MRQILLLAAIPLWSQDALTLREAVNLALRANKGLAAASAARRAADERVIQTRSAVLPKINYSQSFTRSDNPVFVFSSLLTQHEFAASNFDIPSLNRPGFINNFQSQLSADQVLYDAGRTRNPVRSAELERTISSEQERDAQLEVIAGVARAYYRTLLAVENLKAAQQAVHSVEADLKRAEEIRAAGLSTDVDVLSVRVHLAAVNEQRISRAADLDVAKSALNDAIGLSLDTPHNLATPLAALPLPDLTLDALEQEATRLRPAVRQSRTAINIAAVGTETARAAMKPQISVHAAAESDAQRLVTRGGVNWLVAIDMKWNLFNGYGDRARIQEGRELQDRAKAEAQRVESAVRLQVRRAYAELRAAQQRIEVARASVAEAEESLRITQNRYEAGYANVTDLLRNETAVLESRTRFLAAVHDQRVAATMLEFAAGRLAADSEVLN